MTNLDAGVEVVDKMIDVADLGRTAVADGTQGADLRDAIAERAPSDTDWRLYEHCAAVTRLYAIYEEFVIGAVGEWLGRLPDLYGAYADLPDSVRKAYRVGTADILSKHGGDRFAHLTEDQVIRGLADGLAGEPYILRPDAFLTDDRNLRADKLQRVLAQIGVADAWDRVTRNRDVVRWEQNEGGDQKTLSSELSQFVSYRNEAAHGSVTEILSSNRLRDLGNLVRLIARAIADALAGEEIDVLEASGRVRRVGHVIREFSDNVLGVEAAEIRVRTLDAVLVRDGRSGFTSKIQSLEVDNVRYDDLTLAAGAQFGMKLDRTARVGAEVLLYNIIEARQDLS